MSIEESRNILNRKIAAAIAEFETTTGVAVYRVQFDVDIDTDDDYNAILTVDAIPHGEFIGPHDAVKPADH